MFCGFFFLTPVSQSKLQKSVPFPEPRALTHAGGVGVSPTPARGDALTHV